MNWCLELQLLIQEPARNFRWLFSFSLKMFGKSYVAALHNWIYPPAHVLPPPSFSQPDKKIEKEEGHHAQSPTEKKRKEKNAVVSRFGFFSFLFFGGGGGRRRHPLFCSVLTFINGEKLRRILMSFSSFPWPWGPSRNDIIFPGLESCEILLVRTLLHTIKPSVRHLNSYLENYSSSSFSAPLMFSLSGLSRMKIRQCFLAEVKSNNCGLNITFAIHFYFFWSECCIFSAISYIAMMAWRISLLDPYSFYPFKPANASFSFSYFWENCVRSGEGRKRLLLLCTTQGKKEEGCSECSTQDLRLHLLLLFPPRDRDFQHPSLSLSLSLSLSFSLSLPSSSTVSQKKFFSYSFDLSFSVFSSSSLGRGGIFKKLRLWNFSGKTHEWKRSLFRPLFLLESSFDSFRHA